MKDVAEVASLTKELIDELFQNYERITIEPNNVFAWPPVKDRRPPLWDAMLRLEIGGTGNAGQLRGDQMQTKIWLMPGVFVKDSSTFKVDPLIGAEVMEQALLGNTIKYAFQCPHGTGNTCLCMDGFGYGLYVNNELKAVYKTFEDEYKRKYGI